MSANGMPNVGVTTAKRAAEQFDQEFQRYTTKQVGPCSLDLPILIFEYFFIDLYL